MATPKRSKRPSNPDVLTAPIPLTAAMKPPTRPLPPPPPPPSRLIRPNAAFDRLLHKSPVPRTITAAYESLRPSQSAQPPPGGYSVLSDFGMSRDEPRQKPFVGSRLRHDATAAEAQTAAAVENRDAATTSIKLPLPTPVSSMSTAIPSSPPPPPPPPPPTRADDANCRHPTGPECMAGDSGGMGRHPAPKKAASDSLKPTTPQKETPEKAVAQKPTPRPTPKPNLQKPAPPRPAPGTSRKLGGEVGGDGGAPNSKQPMLGPGAEQQVEAARPRRQRSFWLAEEAKLSTPAAPAAPVTPAAPAATASPQTTPSSSRSDANKASSSSERGISGTTSSGATATLATPTAGKTNRRSRVSGAAANAAETRSTGRRISTRATAPDIDPIELPRPTRKHRHSDGATATPDAAPAKRQRASGGSEPAIIIPSSPPSSPPVTHTAQKASPNAKSSVAKRRKPSESQPRAEPAVIPATPHPPPPHPPPPTRQTRSANKHPTGPPPAPAAATRSPEKPTAAPRAPRVPETPETPAPPASSSSQPAPRSLPSRRAAKARQIAGTAEPAVLGSVDGGPGGIFLIPAQILAVTGSLIEPGGRRVSGRRHTLAFPPPATAAAAGVVAPERKEAEKAQAKNKKRVLLGAGEEGQDAGAVAKKKARAVEAQAPPPPKIGSHAETSKGVGAGESSGGVGSGWRRWARVPGSGQAAPEKGRGSGSVRRKVRSIATPPRDKKDRDIYDYNFSDEE